MDTRFWGPSGWKLLHLITFTYTYSAETALSYAAFLDTIPYILPCKFCRASLTDYYRQHPFQIPKEGMNPILDIRRWMYTIHNCVNHKLKKQGLHPHRAPTYSQVHDTYTRLAESSWEDQLMLFWDFLFAVAYHHPKEAAYDSKPLPDCPKGIAQCKNKCEKNKWNLLPWRQRMYWYRRFWVFLPAVLPATLSEQWKKQEKRNPPIFTCRRSMLAWLWRMRCGLDRTFHDPYTSVCKSIAQYSSDCGRSRDAITCRSKRITRKTRRNKTLKKQKNKESRQNG